MMEDVLSRDEYVDSLLREALDVGPVPVPSQPPETDDPTAPAGSDQAQPIEEPPQPELLQTWKVRTMADAYQKRPPQEFLLAGMIALGALIIFFGAPGSLKSMILADLAVCIAGGMPWLPSLDGATRGIATLQAPVLWIDLDNGTRRTDERFDALGRSRALPIGAPLYYVSMPSPWLDASSASLMAQLAELICFFGAKFVVIDNLGLISGSVQENDAQMANVMASLRRICEGTGATVIVIHHQRKSNGGTARKGESLRGHSSIEAALDLALHVDRKQGSDAVLLTPTKERGASFPPVGAMFTYDHAPDTKEMTSAKFFSQPIDLEKTAALDSAIFECLGNEGPTGRINQGDLVKGVKDILPDQGINAIRERIAELVEAGKLLMSQGGGEGKGQATTKWYRLPK